MVNAQYCFIRSFICETCRKGVACRSFSPNFGYRISWLLISRCSQIRYAFPCCCPIHGSDFLARSIDLTSSRSCHCTKNNLLLYSSCLGRSLRPDPCCEPLIIIRYIVLRAFLFCFNVTIYLPIVLIRYHFYNSFTTRISIIWEFALYCQCSQHKRRRSFKRRLARLMRVRSRGAPWLATVRL